MKVVPVITIDGASGTGKGTVSLLVAKRLGWKFLDSGVLYRVLAFAAEKHQVAYDDEKNLEKLANHLDVKFIAHPGDIPSIFWSEEVTEIIRTETMGTQLPSSVLCQQFVLRY